MTHTILQIAQLSVAILLTVLILVQERSAGMSGIFGGGGDGGFYQTRRGLERVVFIATIVCASIFFLLSLGRLWF